MGALSLGSGCPKSRNRPIQDRNERLVMSLAGLSENTSSADFPQIFPIIAQHLGCNFKRVGGANV